MAIQTDIGSLDPDSGTSNNLTQYKNFTYDKLIYEADSGEVVPWIASDWESTPTSASFTIRDDVTCSDGTPLTPENVAENYRQIVAPDSTSSSKGLTVPPDSQIEVDGDVVTISTEEPFPFLLRSVGTIPIVCEKGLQDRDFLVDHSNGTGAYVLDEVNPGDEYVLKKREGYDWNPVAQSSEYELPETVIFKIVSNETTAANMLLNDQLNIATIIGPDSERLLAENISSGTSEQPIGELWFNQRDGEVAESEDMRRGLVQALDLEQLTAVVTDGEGYKPKSMVTLDPVACTGDPIGDRLPSHDIDAAMDSFAAAGWSRSGDGALTKDGEKLTLEIIYANKWGQAMASAAELLAKQLSDVGIDANLQGYDGPAFSAAIFDDHSFDIAWNPFTMDSPRLLRPLVALPENGGVINFSGINNPEHEELIEAAVNKPGAEGCDDWIAAEASLYDAVNVVPFASVDVDIFKAGGLDFDVVKGSVAPWTLHWK